MCQNRACVAARTGIVIQQATYSHRNCNVALDVTAQLQRAIDRALAAGAPQNQLNNYGSFQNLAPEFWWDDPVVGLGPPPCNGMPGGELRVTYYFNDPSRSSPRYTLFHRGDALNFFKDMNCASCCT